MLHAHRLAPFALAALLVAPLAVGAPRAEAAPKRAPHAATSAPSRNAGYRQFTGTVVSLDNSSITVEKGGKAAKQMVFTRSAGMRSTGDVQKDARVTVYWRDEAGTPVAHRVVVRAAAAEGSR